MGNIWGLYAPAFVATSEFCDSSHHAWTHMCVDVCVNEQNYVSTNRPLSWTIKLAFLKNGRMSRVSTLSIVFQPFKNDRLRPCSQVLQKLTVGWD